MLRAAFFSMTVKGRLQILAPPMVYSKQQPPHFSLSVSCKPDAEEYQQVMKGNNIEIKKLSPLIPLFLPYHSPFQLCFFPMLLAGV